MTLDFKELLMVDLIIALIVLVVILIVVGIKLIKTLTRIDKTLDIVDEKLSQTDGVFNIFEKTGSLADQVSDKVIMLVTNLIGKFINKKKGNDLDE